MKPLIFAALSMFSLFAATANAAESAPAETLPATSVQSEQYDYSQDLDIAKVVRISAGNSAAAECGPVVAHMVYVDSKGVTHKLQYTRMGDGCAQG